MTLPRAGGACLSAYLLVLLILLPAWAPRNIRLLITLLPDVVSMLVAEQPERTASYHRESWNSRKNKKEAKNHKWIVPRARETVSGMTEDGVEVVVRAGGRCPFVWSAAPGEVVVALASRRGHVIAAASPLGGLHVKLGAIGLRHSAYPQPGELQQPAYHRRPRPRQLTWAAKRRKHPSASVTAPPHYIACRFLCFTVSVASSASFALLSQSYY